MKIKNILRNKLILQRIGWTFLILAVTGVVAMMGYLVLTTEPNTTPPPAQETEDSTILNDLSTALESADVATLESVSGTEEFGFATRFFEEGVFSAEVAVSLDPPPSGTYYEAWLIGDEAISIGTLSIDQSDSFGQDLYVANFNSKEDLSTINEIIVTQQTLLNETGDTPGTIVLEGFFE
jgi:hypothetical protein